MILIMFLMGQWFESSHQQFNLLSIVRIDENKVKEAGNGPFIKKVFV